MENPHAEQQAVLLERILKNSVGNSRLSMSSTASPFLQV